jgi:hypothetical protein
MTSQSSAKDVSASTTVNDGHVPQKELCIRKLSYFVKGGISSKYVITIDGNTYGTYLICIHENSENSSFSLCGKVEPPLSDEEMCTRMNINNFAKRLHPCDMQDSKKIHDFPFDEVAYEHLTNHVNTLLKK